jgi:hypothetical protein
VLAPGDPVEKLVERELVAAADRERVEELAALVNAGAVRAGQTVALCLGADPKVVDGWGQVLLKGGESDA